MADNRKIYKFLARWRKSIMQQPTFINIFDIYFDISMGISQFFEGARKVEIVSRTEQRTGKHYYRYQQICATDKMMHTRKKFVTDNPASLRYLYYTFSYSSTIPKKAFMKDASSFSKRT